MNRFEYTDWSGDTFVACPTTLRDGTPILAVRVTEYDIVGPANSAVVHVPVAFLEEVIAGLRDMARQASGQPAQCTCGSAGPAFVPAGHYQDCPQYEAPEPAGQLAPQPLTVHINMGDEAALQTAIRDIVRRSGPEGAGA